MNELNQDKAVEAIRAAEIAKDFDVVIVVSNKGNELPHYISKELWKVYREELAEDRKQAWDSSLHDKYMGNSYPEIHMKHDAKVLYMYNAVYAVGSIKDAYPANEWQLQNPNEKVLGFVLGVVAAQEECLEARKKVFDLEEKVVVAFNKAERRQSFETYAAIPELHDLVQSYDLDKDLFK